MTEIETENTKDKELPVHEEEDISIQLSIVARIETVRIGSKEDKGITLAGLAFYSPDNWLGSIWIPYQPWMKLGVVYSVSVKCVPTSFKEFLERSPFKSQITKEPLAGIV